ncbi:hypothetical protein TrRE_jg5308, partial [Triparma retinervis]
PSGPPIPKKKPSSISSVQAIGSQIRRREDETEDENEDEKEDENENENENFDRDNDSSVVSLERGGVKRKRVDAVSIGSIGASGGRPLEIVDEASFFSSSFFNNNKNQPTKDLWSRALDFVGTRGELKVHLKKLTLARKKKRTRGRPKSAFLQVKKAEPGDFLGFNGRSFKEFLGWPHEDGVSGSLVLYR